MAMLIGILWVLASYCVKNKHWALFLKVAGMVQRCLISGSYAHNGEKPLCL